MTISYTESFFGLIWYWHGSVWKSVWKHLLVWLLSYYTIRFVILHVMNDQEREMAGHVARIFNTFCEKIPLSFMLGFYVSQVVTRWWTQIQELPWPDDIMAMTNACLPNPDSKPLRQSLARWLILSQTMVLRRISTRIRRRFPKLDNLLDAGLLTKQELDIIRGSSCLYTRWQLPLEWIVAKIVIPSDIAGPMKASYLGLITTFRASLRRLCLYDWVSIPLVYTQTCSMVVYGYFLFCLLGRQYVGQAIDLYVPWLSILQFVFYVGWLNVAKDLMRPFSEDDDDIELNCLLDRHAAVAISLANSPNEMMPDVIVDETHRRLFQEKMSNSMTYSRSSMRKKDRPPKLRPLVSLRREDMIQIPKKRDVDWKKLDNDDIEKGNRIWQILRNSRTPKNYF